MLDGWFGGFSGLLVLDGGVVGGWWVSVVIGGCIVFGCCLWFVAVVALRSIVGFGCVWIDWWVGVGVYGCAGVPCYIVGLADCVIVGI